MHPVKREAPSRCELFDWVQLRPELQQLQAASNNSMVHESMIRREIVEARLSRYRAAVRKHGSSEARKIGSAEV